MRVCTPWTRAVSSVDRVSGRGGSRKVSRPSICHSPCESVRATAMQRMPLCPNSCTCIYVHRPCVKTAHVLMLWALSEQGYRGFSQLYEHFRTPVIQVYWSSHADTTKEHD